MKRYNLALIPTLQTKEFIQFAQNFQAISAAYLLGPNAHPHVTLQHFICSPEELERVINPVRELRWAELALIFKKVSVVTFDKVLHWIALLPDQRDALIEKHLQVDKIVKSSSKKKFDPHLTLCNTKKIVAAKEILDNLEIPIFTDKFTLCLGESAEMGQLKKVLMVFN